MQQKIGAGSPEPVKMRPLWLVILAAGMIVGLAMGLRQVMGLFLKPMTTELNIGREPFSLAMAVANLVWGFAAVPLGAISDRYGAGRVLVAGALATVSMPRLRPVITIARMASGFGKSPNKRLL